MIITQTPLRVSLAGGGTDFPEFYNTHGGAIVSMAIDKYIYIIVKERYDDLIYLNYSQKEIESNVNQIHHELIREAMKKTDVTKGIEITCLADIPSEGTGLGSSGTFTVGLLNALYTFRGIQVDPERLAQEATEIEMIRVGRPIGLQDQYIAAYGGLNLFEFSSGNKVQVKRVDLENGKLLKVASNILLFYTNKTRSSSTILEDQKNNISKNEVVLSTLKEQAYRVYHCLHEGKFDTIGDVLRETWNFKKKLAVGISNDLIDELYDVALENGVVGGKICGAGGGGFLMLYCPRDKQDQLRSALHVKELPFMMEKWGSRVVFNVSRYVWKI